MVSHLQSAGDCATCPAVGCKPAQGLCVCNACAPAPRPDTRHPACPPPTPNIPAELLEAIDWLSVHDRGQLGALIDRFERSMHGAAQ